MNHLSSRFASAAVTAAVFACGCAQSGLCDQGSLSAALDGADPGDVVEVGDCEVEGASLTVPAGVTLAGTEDSVLLGSAAGPAVTLSGEGAGLERLEVRQSVGAAVVVRDAGSARLSELTIVGPVTLDNAADVPSDPGASDTATLGLLVDGSGNAPGQVVLLEDVEVRGFAVAAVVSLDSRIEWARGGISETLGAGIMVFGGRARLEGVEIRDVLQGARLRPAYAGLFLRGAEVSTEDVLVADSEGLGLLHDAATVAHVGLRALDNHSAGLWVQNSPSFELSGAGTELTGNGRSGLSIFAPAGPHSIRDAHIASTVAIPAMVGMEGREDIADGVHVVAAHTQDITLRAVTLQDNERAGALLHVFDGVVSVDTLDTVTAEASGDGLGVVAQAPSGTISSGDWDSSVERTGAAADNDATVAGQLSIQEAVAPMGLPAPPL